MDHDVERERKTEPSDETGDLEFLAMRSRSGDHLGGRHRGALNAQLNMFQARLAKSAQFLFVEQGAAGYQIRIQVACARMTDQLGEIVAQHGLAAGEVQLHHAKFRGLGNRAAPFGRRKLVAGVGEVDRIAAVNASQRTSIGKFRNERVWTRRDRHCRSPRARIDSRNFSTSSLRLSRSAPRNVSARSSTI